MLVFFMVFFFINQQFVKYLLQKTKMEYVHKYDENGRELKTLSVDRLSVWFIKYNVN